MTHDDVASALDALREAGSRLRARPAGEVLRLLARAFDGWSGVNSSWRSALARELPAEVGMGNSMVRAGLERGLTPYTGAALRDLVARELSTGDAGRNGNASGDRAHVSGFDTTAVLLAGSLPMPTLVAVMAPLVLGSPVLVRPASRDRVTPRRVADSIAELDRGLGECVAIVDFAHDDEASARAFLAADCVVASGSDETIAAVAARVRPWQRFVGYGHRLSIAVIGDAATRDTTLDHTARELAVDIALWDQLGCLSPVAVFVTTGDEDAADRVALAVARELAATEKHWPRGKIARDTAAAIAMERSEAEMRAAAGRNVAVHASDDTAWSVVREADAELRSAPLHRFVRIHPVADVDSLCRALHPLGRHLAAVALAGFGSENARVARALTGLGASRVCAPGRMQSPPLAWRHDNRGVLEPLARFAQIEPVDSEI